MTYEYNYPMRTIAFEGIATSGKTTIIEHLVQLLNAAGKSHLVIREDKTIMPVLYNEEVSASLELLEKAITEAFTRPQDVYIFDRLHLTHVARTESDIATFKSIEQLLGAYNPVIILLTVGEAKIPDRVRWALANRDESWVRHARRRESDEAIFAHYIEQQRDIVRIVGTSTLPHEIIDTSDLDFRAAAQHIYDAYCG